MLLRRSLILATCLLATACGSKFPHNPQFVSTDTVSVAAISAPPAIGSKQYKKEIESIIAIQKNLTAKQKAALTAEVPVTPEMMVLPVLGKRYTQQHYPAMYTLLSHAGSDSWRIGDAAKDHWNTKRPWQVDTRVKLLIDPITSPAYPSGHTTTNAVWASVLSDLFPAKKAALFKRANEIGQNRVKAGVHFPHDVEGGKKLAAMIAAEMKKSPEYQRELAAAKAELKSPVIAAKPAVKLGRNCQTSTHTSGGMVLQACN